MISILLVTLGVPIWLIVGVLGGALWSRRKFRQTPGVFPCKVRFVSGAEASGKWARATVYARWVHDVLLVHAGLALIRYRALPATGIDSVSHAPGAKLKGGDTISVRLRLDDGSVAEVATPASMRESLAGPFLASRNEAEEGPSA